MANSHHDGQVEAFITAINRCGGTGHADVQYADNGEFIIDGVVNVRAALDAVASVGVETVKYGGKIVIVHPDMPAHYWDGERMHRVDAIPAKNS